MKSVLHDVTDERLMLMLRALANPARLQLFYQLRTRDDAHCHDLVEALPLSQSTVSEHIQRLKEAGLVRGEPHGASRTYVIDEDALSWLKQAVSSL
ncbi:metalloregulator ArsR/SmtB family transcription factor [soil metagenome]